jgi:hypothetical protein
VAAIVRNPDLVARNCIRHESAVRRHAVAGMSHSDDLNHSVHLGLGAALVQSAKLH